MYIFKQTTKRFSLNLQKHLHIIFGTYFFQISIMSIKQKDLNLSNQNTNQITSDYINPKQNLNFNQHQCQIQSFTKKKSHHLQQMEISYYQSAFIDLQTRKHSESTYSYSSKNSLEFEQKTNDDSGIKSTRTFSTGISSPESQATLQKEICPISIDNISSLQKRTRSLEVMGSSSGGKLIQTNQMRKSVDMQLEAHKQTNERHGKKNKTTDPIDQQGVSKQNMQDNIKNLQVAFSTQVVQNNIQTIIQTQNKNILTSTNSNIPQNPTHSQIKSTVSPTQSTPLNSSPIQNGAIRPLPTYKQARPRLYDWIRTLCFQMNMCYDVFALTMKYLDEYHETYGHAYNRETFSANAYGMVMVASKIANKKILTPKVVAEKSKLNEKLLREIEMDLIMMMNFKVYFETFVKLLQRKCEKWEESCQKKNLKKELSLFNEDLQSFRRFYGLVQEVQIYARENSEVTKQMMLSAFIKTLAPQFKQASKQQLLVDILCEVFSDLTEEKPQQHSYNNILCKINGSISTKESELNLRNRVARNFGGRKNERFQKNYNIFLNSIFDMKA